jgi:hypothetical protein
VTIDRELRVGALPHVRLRAGRLELLAVPGPYPGVRVEPDQIAAMFAQQGEVLAREGGAAAPAPLVLADSTAAVARILDVLIRLGVDHAELAVAGDVTMAHPVLLERQGRALAQPEIRIEPGGAGLTIVGFGDDRVVGWDQLPGELDHFAAVNAPIRAMEIRPQPDTTVAELVRVMDACVTARVSTLIFVPAQ